MINYLQKNNFSNFHILNGKEEKKKPTECEKRWRVGRETKEVRTQNEVRTHTENRGVCSSLPDSTEEKLRETSTAQNDRTGNI